MSAEKIIKGHCDLPADVVVEVRVEEIEIRSPPFGGLGPGRRETRRMESNQPLRLSFEIPVSAIGSTVASLRALADEIAKLR